MVSRFPDLPIGEDKAAVAIWLLAFIVKKKVRDIYVRVMVQLAREFITSLLMVLEYSSNTKQISSGLWESAPNHGNILRRDCIQENCRTYGLQWFELCEHIARKLKGGVRRL